ncbi:MAG: aminotransferase class I/II-fold pyridoxal phosphate-dependent enzyme [Deltaproteobacteria bacterium]|nr:aminotransferase class I/II-fold pyridoxal phosphate-dependent enzyme [Deltaproteobacteria bacterium]MBW1953376.1 aminotransferase class I/II-fold pyridoxal phosphate-dependent enzyme [Deltaproteobacteria bacterium]MBW1987852.1 aminotransferase class I/II-fold pyridoxal phosphate-dependent enzyme [Deltaproteobacteria bacterium]MBW2134569.1 aminotransferase class I/II-fold pyridoxal phosphate-dependent enzyme [Deltaproteobacteria bacterium]
MEEFPRMQRLPEYVFATVNALKMEARRRQEDIVDLGMGNPDLPTPQHIVDKLIEAAQKAHNHRYSASRGITKLRGAIADWYKRRFNVDIDPETEAIATIGAKEGLSHLVLATISPGEVVLVPNPTYPIHAYSVVISGGDLVSIPLDPERDFFEDLVTITRLIRPRPKMLIISFPHNPTTAVVEREFFEKVVAYAQEYNVMIVHDFAYADLVFDGYVAPSFLEIPGAKEVGVELFSLSKSYSMPGWRLGFTVGNPKMVHALTRIKSYLDYGVFQPIQIAGIIALNGPYEPVQEIVNVYKERRDALCRGLQRIGWRVESPKGTMFVWAKIPKKFRDLKSVEFCKMLIQEAKVAVSPGLGFGEYGDDYVRFALVENVHRINQAIRGLRKVLQGKKQ